MDSWSSRIVVGYDGSCGADTALDWAAAEAARRDVPLLVLHAAHSPVVNAYDVPTLVAAQGFQRGRRLAAPAVVSSRTITGAAAPALVAASQDSALVVLGTNGRGAATGELFGSVCVAVAAEAGCPVVVVRGSTELPGPDRPVVVGIDGSAESEVALRYAADVAAGYGSPLTVVTAWDGHPAGHGITGWLPRRPSVSRDRRTRDVADEIASAASELAAALHPRLTVTCAVPEGRAGRVLPEVCVGAGLAVVGSRGRHGLAGLVLGSTSHALMHAAPCPVTVVRGD
jgi:nucleotide-binding universal stress UspA family protein